MLLPVDKHTTFFCLHLDLILSLSFHHTSFNLRKFKEFVGASFFFVLAVCCHSLSRVVVFRISAIRPQGCRARCTACNVGNTRPPGSSASPAASSWRRSGRTSHRPHPPRCPHFIPLPQLKVLVGIVLPIDRQATFLPPPSPPQDVCKCPGCGTAQPPGKFCIACGKPLQSPRVSQCWRACR